MQANKMTNILLGIIALVLIVGIALFFTHQTSTSPAVQTTPRTDVMNNTIPSQTQNSQTQNNQTSTSNSNPIPVANPGWTTASANGMSVSMPPGYSQNTGLPAALEGKGTSLNIAYNGTMVLGILKFSDQGMFNESIPQGANSGYSLVNSNYPVSGLVGQYYQDSQSVGGQNLIVVPSKLAIITIEPLSYSGIPQTTLNKIIGSINL